jgi:nucleotide-binding universal stress UspA family protein
VDTTSDSIVPAWILHWSASAGRCLGLRTNADEGRLAAIGPTDLLLHVPRSVSRTARRGLVVVALRDLPEEEKVLSTAAEAATYLGAVLAVRHAVPVSFGERSVGLGDAIDHGHLLLAAAHDQLATAHVTLPVVTELRRMWPHEMVGESVDADLMVIGGPRTTSDGALGLVARSAVHHALCPLLLVPRPSLPAPMPQARPKQFAPA